MADQDSDREEATPSTPRGGALWMVAAAVTYWVGQWIGLPGIDHELLAQLGRADGTLSGLFDVPAPAFPLLGASVSTLVMVHLVLLVTGRDESRTARRVGAAVFLLLSAVQGFSIALWLEGLAYQASYLDVVPSPGMRFRLITTLTFTAGAAVLWWLVDRVDASRRAHGALFLLLVSTATTHVAEATRVGADVGNGALSWLGAAGVLAVPVSVLIAGAAVTLRPPERWPVPLLARLRLRSAWDVLAVVLLGGIPGRAIASALTYADPDAPARWVGALETAGSVAVAVGFAAWWWRSRSGERPASRPWWAVSLSGAFAAAVVGLVAGGWVIAGGLERAATPGPLAGEQTFELVLEAETSFAGSDGAAMVHRLESLGASAEVAEADARRIVLRVDGAAGIDPVLEALRPRQFGLHLLVWPAPERSPVPDGVTVDQRMYEQPRPEYLGDCEAVERWRDSLRDARPEDPCLHAVQRIEDLGYVTDDPRAAPAQRCALRCLVPTPALTAAHVEDASVVTDPQMGMPVVSVTLTEEGAARMSRTSRENLRRPLAIVAGGEVLSMPIIQSEIGARVQITLGSVVSPMEATLEARSLANALRPAGRISTGWTLAETRAY